MKIVVLSTNFRVPGLSVMPGIWHEVPESLKRVVKKSRKKCLGNLEFIHEHKLILFRSYSNLFAGMQQPKPVKVSGTGTK